MIEEPVLSRFKAREESQHSGQEVVAGQMSNVRVGVTADDPAELARRVDDEILSETRDVDHEEGAREEVLGDEISIGDRLLSSSGNSQ